MREKPADIMLDDFSTPNHQLAVSETRPERSPSDGRASVCERSDILQDLAREIRTLQTANRPQKKSISNGSPQLDACLPSGGYLPGSILEILTEQGPTVTPSRLSHSPRTRPLLTRGCGAFSVALRISREWIASGKYLVLVTPHLNVAASPLNALQIPLERVILVRPDPGADWIWGIDQALRSRAVGALITSVEQLDDRVARRWQLAVEQGGGLGIFLRDRAMAKRYPSWAEVQWQLRSLAPSTQPNSPFQTPRVRGIEPRWFEFTLQRAPAARIGKQVQIGIGSDGNWVEYEPKVESIHDRKLAQERTPAESTVHLASQLAMATNRRRESAAG